MFTGFKQENHCMNPPKVHLFTLLATLQCNSIHSTILNFHLLHHKYTEYIHAYNTPYHHSTQDLVIMYNIINNYNM